MIIAAKTNEPHPAKAYYDMWTGTGTPPYAGGLRDQPARLVLQCMVIHEQRKRMERKEIDALIKKITGA